MEWQKASKEDSFTAEGFVFSGGGQMEVRLAYRTLGTRCPAATPCC